MRIGVPKEIKIHEYRVGLVPSSVRELVHSGHQVFVEKSAGAGAGIGDEAYRQVGARIVDSAEEVFSAAEMLVKVNAAMAKSMKPGAAIVDVAIDQGGCFETSRPTTHAQPTYLVDGVVHYSLRTCPGQWHGLPPLR
jgi:alanine dehydrogenase